MGVIYDYQCYDCDRTWDQRWPMHAKTNPNCKCGSSNVVKRIVAAPASVLDWKDSDSVHLSKRFRPRTVRRAKEVEAPCQIS